MEQTRRQSGIDWRFRFDSLIRNWTVWATLVLFCGMGGELQAQVGGRNDPIPPPPPKERAPDVSTITANVSQDSENLIANVVFNGNRVLPDYHLARNIGTRPGRYLDPDQLQQDVDTLWRMPGIKRVDGPFIERTPEGLNITFGIVERIHVQSLEFIGNRGITDRALKKQTDLEIDQPLDLHRVKMARTRLEEYYHEKGYPDTQVEILDIDQVEQGKITFLIHEDEQQRIWSVEFVGNTFVSDARLKNFIKSKPGILKVIKGTANEKEIDQDIVRLESYYKSFGFFNARIGREIQKSDSGKWLTIRYIIDEGPRYRIRNVSFIGNRVYTSDQLDGMVELKPDNGALPEFNVSKMNQDVVKLRDLYGSQGFVYSDVQAEPRFLEQPGMLDIVYRISEGEQYRVRNINVHIDGNSSVTRREVALNRVSLKPGDLIDVRSIRNSERLLGSARIFADGSSGPGSTPPRIVVQPPEAAELQRLASQNGQDGTSYR